MAGTCKFLFSTAYNVIRDRENNFAACQTLFLWLWENREQIRVESTLRGYLYVAIKLRMPNLIRHGKYRETLFSDLKETYILVYYEYEL